MLIRPTADAAWPRSAGAILKDVPVFDPPSNNYSRFMAASTLHGPAPAKVKYRKTKQ
jgi:hypothetical protein